MIYCCLTTYPKRVQNVPRVLDSLRDGFIRPDRFIVTIAEQDNWMRDTFTGVTDVEVLTVPVDTKVWKKFLPAMQMFQPDDLVLTVDDDYLYDRLMLSELLAARYRSLCVYEGGAPVSGNHYWHNGLKCHCGCASLVQPRHFAGWEDYARLFDRIESSDMFYTMLAAKNRFAYVQTPTDWQHALQPFNEGEGYSKRHAVQRSYDIIAREFGWSK